MCAHDSQDELEDEFETSVRRQRVLIEKGRREKGESFWGYVGLIGAVGWGIVLPMIIGVGVGLWLDRRFGGGSKLTLLLLLLGLSVGCVNAWRTITREH